VVEEKADIRDVSLATWRTAIQVLSSLTTDEGGLWLECIVSAELVLEWHEIVMTPLGAHIDTAKLFSPSTDGHGASERHNIDKSILNQDLSLVSPELILRGRVAAAKALALLIAAWPSEASFISFTLYTLY
jgi:TATA-binding protein-associated factor